MGTLSRDTDREAERVLIEIMRALPAWKKLALLDDAARPRGAGACRPSCAPPAATEDTLRRMLMDLLLGEEIATRVWGRSTSRSDDR